MTSQPSVNSSQEGVPVDLEGRTIVVAGGTGNVGRYVVGGLLEAGATVVVPSRSPDKLEAIKAVGQNGSTGRVVTVLGDVTDEVDGPRIVQGLRNEVGPLHGAVASLGGFVPVPSILEASREQLATALEGYVRAHLGAAQNLVPALEGGGGYLFINGPLAFDLWSPEASLVSVVTAAQAMLARAVAKEVDGPPSESRRSVPSAPPRVNELVIYTAVGWGEADKKSPVSPRDIGRYVAHLLSERAESTRGETIHLRSPDQLQVIGRRSPTGPYPHPR